MFDIHKARSTSLIFKALAAGFVFLLILFDIDPAFCQVVTASDVIYNLNGATKYMPETIEIVAYICGLYAIYSGILALKETSQKPGEKPIKPAIIRFIAAACLIALPRMVLSTTKNIGVDDLSQGPLVKKTTLMKGL